MPKSIVQSEHRHRRSHIHLPQGLGEKVADSVVSAMGSWKFIIIQTVVIVAWVAGNVWFIFHFDPYQSIQDTSEQALNHSHGAIDQENWLSYQLLGWYKNEPLFGMVHQWRYLYAL